MTNPRAFGFTDFDSLHYDVDAYTLIEDAFQNIHKIGADCRSFYGHGSNSSSPRFCHMLPRYVRLFAPFWSSHPVELGDAWTLRKGEKVLLHSRYAPAWMGTSPDDE